MHDLQPGKQVECQVCSSKDIEEVVDLGFNAPCDSLLWPEDLDKSETRFPLRLVRCKNCGLAQIDHVVPADILFFKEYPYRSGITPTLVKNLQSTGRTTCERMGVRAGSMVVDIGSNDGTLLKGFKSLGMKVLGVEPTNIADIANSEGIETIQSFFCESTGKEIRDKYGPVDIATAANMFAHVDKLGELIRGVEKMLSADGVFITESHYVVDLLETLQYDSIYHEHLKYYSVGSLKKLFSYYDFTVIDVDRINNYGGSIRVYAQKGKGRVERDSVKELLAMEKEMGIDDGEIFAEFAMKVKDSKIKLKKMLANAKADGLTIAGIGCPGRAATLLSYCGIDKDTLDYVAEQSSSLKIGLYTPGTQLPIVDESRLIEQQPDICLMLSWHYYAPIVEKLREKGLKSKIIIPLPEPFIV